MKKKLTRKVLFEMGWRASNAGLPRTLMNVEEWWECLNELNSLKILDVAAERRNRNMWKNWYRGYDSATLMANVG